MIVQPSLIRRAAGADRRRRTPATARRLAVCADAFAAGAYDRAEALLERLCGHDASFQAREDVLASTARALGERWVDDSCDFATLTLAMARLHAVLRRTGRGGAMRPIEPLRHVLLAPAPGEQHGFGAAVLAQAFHEAGWRVSAPPACTTSELVARVRSGDLDMVGLSLACDAGLERLAQVVAALRAARPRGGPVLLVGGRPFMERPELAASLGADGTAADCASTLTLADELRPVLRAVA